MDKEASSKGKKAARKNTIAGLGDDEDLLKIAKEQQEKYQKEMDERLEIAKKAQSERDAAEEAARLEAQAAKKRSAETKAVAKAAAKAEKAEEGVDESAHVDVGELSEDNEEAGQNSLFMESVEVDKVTSGDSPPLQDKVKGKYDDEILWVINFKSKKMYFIYNMNIRVTSCPWLTKSVCLRKSKTQ